MRKIIVSIVLSLFMVVNASLARTFVLVTGVSSYQNSEANLQQTTKDAKAFAKVIRTQTNDVTLLTSSYASHDNILEKLRALVNRAQKGDRIIFYFSGHGTPGAICAYDRVVFYSELVSLLKRSAASEKILFVDACHAGSVNDGEGAYKLSADDGIICFMSSRASEYSKESALVGAGFFTQGLIKGIRGKADDDGNRQITIYELFKYTYTDVVKRSKEQQHPQLIAPKSSYSSIIARW